MNDTPHKSRGVFHANLQQVAGGLYRAEYSGEINPEPTDARNIPDYHVGTDAAAVKMWVEEMAVGMGFERVEWDVLPEGVEL